jgi:putative ABC transport system permease protein
MGIFTLLLAGLGIQSALRALLKEKEATIAIMKAVGATSSFITSQFLVVLGVLGLTGTLTGLAFGSLVQVCLPALFRGLIPQGVEPTFSVRIIFEGFFLGTGVVALFAFLPLQQLKHIKPSAIFRKEDSLPPRGLPSWLVGSAILLLFTGLALWQLNDFQIGLLFVFCAAAFLSVAAMTTRLLLLALKRARPRSLVTRQALRGLFRPRSATHSIVVTLTASLSILFSIYLLEQNLDETFIRSYPSNLPNVFFLDIQPVQLEAFSEELGMDAEYYPVVRGSVTEINGTPIDPEEESRKRGDNFAREFNLTYRDHLLRDESLVEGRSLFREDGQEIQVSVLDTVVKMKAMKVGDRIGFKIQGIPMEARISSIRTREGELFQPFFYFVFQEDVLKDAPQTIFTALRIEPDRIASVQSRIVSRFPNVTVVDVTQTVSALGNVMHRLSTITRFFTLFSMSAGILILVSSVFSTRYSRIREAVYFKILGAPKLFVLRVFALENALIGLLSALLALLLSQAGCKIITGNLLDIPYKPFPWASFILVVGTVSLVTTVGLLSSLSILKHKPVAFLREQTEE